MDKSSDFNLLLQPQLQNYIIQHEGDDERKLVLRGQDLFGVSAVDVAQQIVGRRKAKTKLPSMYASPKIVYPPAVNLEQCSSERTAKFKSKLFKGKYAIDLTGGIGIDCFFLSQHFEQVIYVESNEKLLKIAQHNHGILGVGNIEYHCQDAEAYIKTSEKNCDLIYVDPSRRSTSDKKVFKFKECSPDVIRILPILAKIANNILIKASPMIDIKQGMKELGNVSRVFVVGYNNECKEVLFLIGKKTAIPTIEAVDLSDDGLAQQTIAFDLAEEAQSEILYSEPKKLLYEPNAMILKAGAFKVIAKRYNLKKIAPNTHLYTSDNFHKNFPGRIFNIEYHLKSNRKSIQKYLPDGHANVTTRNYPLTPAQVKKKLKLKDGGDQFVFGFSGQEKKYLVLATRLN